MGNHHKKDRSNQDKHNQLREDDELLSALEDPQNLIEMLLSAIPEDDKERAGSSSGDDNEGLVGGIDELFQMSVECLMLQKSLVEKHNKYEKLAALGVSATTMNSLAAEYNAELKKLLDLEERIENARKALKERAENSSEDDNARAESSFEDDNAWAESSFEDDNAWAESSPEDDDAILKKKSVKLFEMMKKTYKLERSIEDKYDEFLKLASLSFVRPETRNAKYDEYKAELKQLEELKLQIAYAPQDVKDRLLVWFNSSEDDDDFHFDDDELDLFDDDFDDDDFDFDDDDFDDDEGYGDDFDDEDFDDDFDDDDFDDEEEGKRIYSPPPPSKKE